MMIGDCFGVNLLSWEDGGGSVRQRLRKGERSVNRTWFSGGCHMWLAHTVWDEDGY